MSLLELAKAAERDIARRKRLRPLTLDYVRNFLMPGEEGDRPDIVIVNFRDFIELCQLAVLPGQGGVEKDSCWIDGVEFTCNTRLRGVLGVAVQWDYEREGI